MSQACDVKEYQENVSFVELFEAKLFDIFFVLSQSYVGEGKSKKEAKLACSQKAIEAICGHKVSDTRFVNFRLGLMKKSLRRWVFRR